MASSIHIQRVSGAGTRRAIQLEEWIAVIRSTDGVRILPRDIEYSSSLTGKSVMLKGQMRDAEIYDPRRGCWMPSLVWNKGVVVLNSLASLVDSDSVIRQKATELAAKLGADLIESEGESYR